MGRRKKNKLKLSHELLTANPAKGFSLHEPDLTAGCFKQSLVSRPSAMGEAA